MPCRTDAHRDAGDMSSSLPRFFVSFRSTNLISLLAFDTMDDQEVGRILAEEAMEEAGEEEEEESDEEHQEESDEEDSVAGIHILQVKDTALRHSFWGLVTMVFECQVRYSNFKGAVLSDLDETKLELAETKESLGKPKRQSQAKKIRLTSCSRGSKLKMTRSTS